MENTATMTIGQFVSENINYTESKDYYESLKVLAEAEVARINYLMEMSDININESSTDSNLFELRLSSVENFIDDDDAITESFKEKVKKAGKAILDKIVRLFDKIKTVLTKGFQAIKKKFTKLADINGLKTELREAIKNINNNIIGPEKIKGFIDELKLINDSAKSVANNGSATEISESTKSESEVQRLVSELFKALRNIDSSVNPRLEKIDDIKLVLSTAELIYSSEGMTTPKYINDLYDYFKEVGEILAYHMAINNYDTNLEEFFSKKSIERIKEVNAGFKKINGKLNKINQDETVSISMEGLGKLLDRISRILDSTSHTLNSTVSYYNIYYTSIGEGFKAAQHSAETSHYSMNAGLKDIDKIRAAGARNKYALANVNNDQLISDTITAIYTCFSILNKYAAMALNYFNTANSNKVIIARTIVALKKLQK